MRCLPARAKRHSGVSLPPYLCESAVAVSVAPYSQFPAPLTLEDTIGDAIIASLRNAVHRPPPTTEHAEALAVCLEAGFEQLSGRCVRALAEELLATLFSYLCLPAAAPRVKVPPPIFPRRSGTHAPTPDACFLR